MGKKWRNWLFGDIRPGDGENLEACAEGIDQWKKRSRRRRLLLAGGSTGILLSGVVLTGAYRMPVKLLLQQEGISKADEGISEGMQSAETISFSGEILAGIRFYSLRESTSIDFWKSEENTTEKTYSTAVEDSTSEDFPETDSKPKHVMTEETLSETLPAEPETAEESPAPDVTEAVQAVGILAVYGIKGSYYVEDVLDYRYIQVSLVYEDGTSVRVDGWSCRYEAPMVQGQNAYTVEYQGFSATFSVEAVPVPTTAAPTTAEPVVTEAAAVAETTAAPVTEAPTQPLSIQSAVGPLTPIENFASTIRQMLLTPNPNSRPGIKLEKVKNIVIHYIGNPGSSAINNWNYFESFKNSSTLGVSSHFLVGLEGEIIQCIPLDEKSYATNWRNKDTISIEVCHPDSTGKFNDVTYASVVRLTAWLCHEFNLTAEDVIRHHDVTGKICPRYYVNNPAAWAQLKADVAQYLALGVF